MATSVKRLREPTVGELKDQIIFQRNDMVSDGQAGQTDSWSDYAQLWSRVLPISKGAMFLARQIESRVTHQIIIRYSTTSGQISRGDRIIFNDRNGERMFIVEDVADMNNQRRWTEIGAFEDIPKDFAP